jgi:hypothetical protein
LRNDQGDWASYERIGEFWHSTDVIIPVSVFGNEIPPFVVAKFDETLSESL